MAVRPVYIPKNSAPFYNTVNIEFNPQKGMSTQAKSAAVYVSLSNLGLLEKVREYSSFYSLFLNNKGGIL